MVMLSHINHQEGSWSHTLKRHEIWSLFGEAEALCIIGLDSVLTLLLPVTPGTPEDRHFAYPWLNLKVYAFPPIKLTPVVLYIVRECGIRLLLVVLFWPSQTWFSELTFLVE